MKATFFILAIVAEQQPELVEAIHEAGHEIASHGYGHELVYKQTETQFREDLLRSKRILEEIIGEPIFGYRAPSFRLFKRPRGRWISSFKRGSDMTPASTPSSMTAMGSPTRKDSLTLCETKDEMYYGNFPPAPIG